MLCQGFAELVKGNPPDTIHHTNKRAINQWDFDELSRQSPAVTFQNVLLLFLLQKKPG